MTTSLDARLRALDPAPPTTPAERARLDTRLEAMLTTVPATVAEPTEVASVRGSARTTGRAGALRPRRVAGLLAAAAAVAVVGVLLPSPDGRDVAWATWTPEPTAATPAEVAAVADRCRDRVSRGGPEGWSADAMSVALAERRGDVVAVVLRDPERDLSGYCLADLPSGATEPRALEVALAGSEGPPAVAPADGFLEGSTVQFGGDEIVSMTDGAVGDDVVGLTIHADGHTVEATVEDGRYTAWWPGRVFADVDPGPSGAGGPEPQLTVDLTLADGTVLRGVAPAEPTWPDEPATRS